MSDESTRAVELRAEFDRSFAAPARNAADDLESVVAFGVAGDRFAIRLLEISGISKTGKIVPVPNKTSALLGLAGIRGELLPVYSLSALLDYSGDAEIRWLLICGESARIGLGVSDFHGCFKVSKAAFSSTAGPAGRAWSEEVAVIGSTAHTVIGISSLFTTIRELKKEGV